MSKKKVSLEAIDSILGTGAEEPQSNEVVETSTKQEKAKRGRPRVDDYEARTFRVRKEVVQKLRIIANREGRLQKDILEFALDNVIARYEEKNGVIDTSRDYSKKSLEDIF
jgi:hypothetical protein